MVVKIPFSLVFLSDCILSKSVVMKFVHQLSKATGQIVYVYGMRLTVDGF